MQKKMQPPPPPKKNVFIQKHLIVLNRVPLINMQFVYIPKRKMIYSIHSPIR